MCLFVYLGVDGEIQGFGAPKPGEFGLNPNPLVIPPVLEEKTEVYEVCQRGVEGWCCSCDLYHHHLPWEDEAPEPAVLSAYRTLRTIVSDAQSKGLRPLLFSVWVGEETDELRVTWKLAVNDLVPENNLFEEYEKTGGGRPPPTMVMFDDSIMSPIVEYAR